MKKECTEWEKIFANDATDKQLMYKQLMQLNLKNKQLNLKNKQPNQKMGRRPE